MKAVLLSAVLFSSRPRILKLELAIHYCARFGDGGVSSSLKSKLMGDNFVIRWSTCDSRVESVVQVVNGIYSWMAGTLDAAREDKRIQVARCIFNVAFVFR